ncbi:hypothetical protein Golob_012084 [Gossypium lobatum]|uniref:Uncharacterized protein n=1 Tax=Gossypium lobatum TaxID=34289 RepID=A0A7J8MRI9_9ROSI|nr:hypothetical protein [Gossypium lobatum]
MGEIEQITDFIGFKIGNLLDKYLGIPLMTRKSSDKDSLPLFENVKERISNWMLLLLELGLIGVIFLHLKMKEAKSFLSTKKINILLDNSNYLLWRQQVLLTIKTHKLQHFLDGRMTPPPMLVPDNDGVFQENPLFDMSSRTMLLPPSSCRLLVKVFLIKIKSYYDNLASSREVISEHDHVTMILNGLSPLFEYVITVITASQMSYNVQDITTMLLDAEARLQNIMVGMSSSDNVVTHHQADSTVASMSSLTYYPASSSGHPCGCGHGRSSGSRIQCQLCGKNAILLIDTIIGLMLPIKVSVIDLPPKTNVCMFSNGSPMSSWVTLFSSSVPTFPFVVNSQGS